VSEFDRRSSFRKSEGNPSRDEVFDDSVFDQAAAEAAPTEGREGLPPTFRMRHDRHYVDQITSRTVAPPVQLVAVHDIDGARPPGPSELEALVESILSFGVVQPLLVRRRDGRYQLIAGSKRLAAAKAAGLTEVPCLLQEADDERAQGLAEADNLRFQNDGDAASTATKPSALPAGVAREILDSLSTIESCLSLFLERDRPLRERVSADLMRAEARRARWLAEAYGLLGGTPAIVRKPLDPASLVERTLQSLEAEGRLANVELALAVDEPKRTLFADERLMSVALIGAAGAMLGLLQGIGGATLNVRVSTNPATRLLAFQISQDQVMAPDAWRGSADGAVLPDRPRDRGAAVGLIVARRAVQLQGGRLEVTSGPRAGCTVTVTLPAGD
jgi:ParB-like chromosome segregation protein Spo0J